MAKFIDLADHLRQKRTAQYKQSGFRSITNSDHMCAILKDGVPISFGSNIYNRDNSTEHAEAQALRKLCERIGKRFNAKKITIDIFVVRANGGNSTPCARCIKSMEYYSQYFYIRNIYYTHPNEPLGIRSIKFSKFTQEKKHYCSFDRNIDKILNDRTHFHKKNY